MPTDLAEIEKRLWDSADELRANSKLKASEYSKPVLGLIFLRYADHKFSAAQEELEGKSTGRRRIGKTDYQAEGILYIPDAARFSSLLQLPEGGNIGGAQDPMAHIVKHLGNIHIHFLSEPAVVRGAASSSAAWWAGGFACGILQSRRSACATVLV